MSMRAPICWPPSLRWMASCPTRTSSTSRCLCCLRLRCVDTPRGGELAVGANTVGLLRDGARGTSLSRPRNALRTTARRAWTRSVRGLSPGLHLVRDGEDLCAFDAAPVRRLRARPPRNVGEQMRWLGAGTLPLSRSIRGLSLPLSSLPSSGRLARAGEWTDRSGLAALGAGFFRPCACVFLLRARSEPVCVRQPRLSRREEP